jgi:asparagine synthetase B (glutamine-hydrolysing)
MAQPDSFFGEHAKLLTKAHKELLFYNLSGFFNLKIAQVAIKPDYSPSTYNEHDKKTMEKLDDEGAPTLYIEDIRDIHNAAPTVKKLSDFKEKGRDGLITVVQTEDEVEVGDGTVGRYTIIAQYNGYAFSKNRKKRSTTKTSMRKKRHTTKTSMRKKRSTMKTSMRKKRHTIKTSMRKKRYIMKTSMHKKHRV